ncbi:MAG: pyridoxamine 5'-phosphate oxidase family protein [Halobacteriales archaeon]
MARSIPEAAADLIDGAKVMVHLATCDDGDPHVAPVWYGYDDGVVEVTTGGRKLANLRANPRVALSFQKDRAGETLWRVTALGTAEVVDDEAALAAATRRINRKYGVPEDAYRENTLVRVDLGSASHRTYE